MLCDHTISTSSSNTDKILDVTLHILERLQLNKDQRQGQVFRTLRSSWNGTTHGLPITSSSRWAGGYSRQHFENSLLRIGFLTNESKRTFDTADGNDLESEFILEDLDTIFNAIGADSSNVADQCRRPISVGLNDKTTSSVLASQIRCFNRQFASLQLGQIIFQRVERVWHCSCCRPNCYICHTRSIHQSSLEPTGTYHDFVAVSRVGRLRCVITTATESRCFL